jgi:hypothetical protein
LDITTLIQKSIEDDAFMGFSIVRNIVLGNGITMDGKNLTNGFQPLWIFILLPFFIKDNPFFLIRVAMILSSLFHVLTGYLIYKTLILLKHRKAAVFSSLVWVFNPFIIFLMFSLLETSLYCFLIILTTYCLLKAEEKSFPAKLCLVVGVLLGLSLLARMDFVFYVFSLFIYLVLKYRSKILPKIMLMGLCLVVVTLPWFLWSYFTFGTIFQSSGEILTYKAHYNFLLKNSFFSFELLKKILYNVFNVSVYTLEVFYPKTIFILFFVLSPVVVLKKLKRLNFIFLFILILFGYYTIWFWNFAGRYVSPIVLVFSVFSGVLYQMFLETKFSRSVKITLFILMICEFLMLGITLWNTGRFPHQKKMYEGAIWLKENTNTSDVIGAFNSGIYSYFSDRNVINLDGLMNWKAVEAIKNKTLINYIKSEKIKYIIDFEDEILSNQIYMEEPLANHFTPIKEITANETSTCVCFFNLCIRCKNIGNIIIYKNNDL